MRHVIKHLFFIACFVPMVASANMYQVRSIQFWNPEIPASPIELAETIAQDALIYSFDSDEGTCGGELVNASLREHRRVMASDENLVHLVKVRFQVTVPVDYCASEKIMNCEIQYKIENNRIRSSRWKCEN